MEPRLYAGAAADGNATIHVPWQARSRRLADMKYRYHLLSTDEFRFTPGTLEIERNPSSFLGTIVPVFVVLKEDLQAFPLNNVQDTVVMRISFIKVRGRTLAHLGVDFVEFKEQLIHVILQRLGVQPDTFCLPQRDGIAVGRVTRIQGVADLLGPAPVFRVIREDLKTKLRR